MSSELNTYYISRSHLNFFSFTVQNRLYLPSSYHVVFMFTLYQPFITGVYSTNISECLPCVRWWWYCTKLAEQVTALFEIYDHGGVAEDTKWNKKDAEKENNGTWAAIYFKGRDIEAYTSR